MLTPPGKSIDLAADSGRPDFPALLASAVHDLKNSVGSLLNTLNGTDSDARSEDTDTNEMVARLRHEAMHINNNLVALLAVYKFDQGRYPVHIDHHCVNDMLMECVLQYTPVLESGRITVETLCPEDLYGCFDRTLTAGIINNALNNALRHTRDRLVIRAEACRGGVNIAVEDNGPGYPAYLLNCDVHAANGIDFSAGTTGLGLYFASLAAGQHKNKQRCGYIQLHNGGRLGGGCFSLHLP